jgi:hypothetical protein
LRVFRHSKNPVPEGFLAASYTSYDSGRRAKFLRARRRRKPLGRPSPWNLRPLKDLCT